MALRFGIVFILRVAFGTHSSPLCLPAGLSDNIPLAIALFTCPSSTVAVNFRTMGRFSFRISRKRFKRLAVGLVVSVVLFLLMDALFPFQAQVPWSTVVTARDSTLIHAFLSSDDKWRMQLGQHEVTPALEAAFLEKEDARFYYHPGIDPLAIARAGWNNIVHGKRTSGASTITMQVARMLNRKPRTYGNKLLEMFNALQLELHLSKTEILHLYLNLAPYGGNIEGVKAASYLYFQKSPERLSVAEIAALTVIPNRPNTLRLGRNNQGVVVARNHWLKRYAAAGIFSGEVLADALDEPLDAVRHAAPQTAPHLSLRLRAAHPNQALIATTLDRAKQAKLESVVSDYMNRLRGYNISNAAVLVVNNHTHEVEAYVGSASFTDFKASGQVDGIRAVRSPGSTLKPLVYGLAFEKGLATGKTVVSDVRSSFSGYEPENYDQTFRGKVPVDFALSNSLNVPAVRLLEKLSPDTLIDRLARIGFRQVKRERDNLGLSIALGGCGVRLEELVRLYSALANYGVAHNLCWQLDQPIRDSVRLLRPEAAWMVTSILTGLTRPDLPVTWQQSQHMPRIAWKTGTSYGRKDAWSIGFNTDYTVGVWVGNFSGEGVPELNGAGMASPLLFQAFNAIQYNQPRGWHAEPEGVDIRWVCSQTGQPPSHFCEDQVMDDFIPGISNNSLCKHLISVDIDADSTLSYCTTCRPNAGYKTVRYPNHAPEYVTWLLDHQQQVHTPPKHNPECERVFANGAPQITSPAANMEYLVDSDDSLSMMLSCHTAQQVEMVYWYVNNRLLRTAKASETVFFTPPAGRVKISCTDDQGRNANVFIEVKNVRL